MKLVGRIPRALVDGGEMVRMKYPPYDVLVAKVGERYVALEDACNHAGASLSQGWREGDDEACVGCPMHGYLFDLRDGKLVQPAGMCDDQRTFEVKVDGDDLVVWDPVTILIF